MTFSSGLFALDVGFWEPAPTAAWAECAVDLMGQPIVRFHHVVADGVGTDTFGWYDILFLRVDYLNDRLDLVVHSEGDWSIEASFEISDIDIHDALADARLGEADPQDLLVLLLDAASPRVRAFPLTADDIARIDALPLIADSSVEEEVARRGLWQPDHSKE